MKTKSSSVLSNSFPILLLIFLAAAASVPQIAMSAEQPEQAAPAAQEATVQIVYLDRPADADPEEFHIRTLAPVLGSEEKAKEAVLYHYKHAASGFSAKLTPQQVEELKSEYSILFFFQNYARLPFFYIWKMKREE
ncbi:hypothetical protein DAI22_05g172000 [Oryza sativa Japonica Group]|jgi:hypothetical protein|nr:hypothetical protein DAI22_05g172000 [Oryza sativa Japonica Group]